MHDEINRLVQLNLVNVDGGPARTYFCSRPSNCRMELHLKGLPMRKPLAEGKYSPTLTAVDDLQREMDALLELRKAVAEAERSNLERRQRPLARRLSANPRGAYPS